ncbi:ABC transporter substrate-binding protein [Micrococcales bacterium 31B]|nr:ABC transporter substrate-binding protein [Micrococcales bacterium 31B]
MPPVSFTVPTVSASSRAGRRVPRVRLLAAVVAVAAVGTLTGCSGSASGASTTTVPATTQVDPSAGATDASSAAPASTAEPGSTTYPVTVMNCGTEVTFAAAPQRVVAIKSTSTDMLLALGQGDKIVGTAFQDSPVVEQYAAEAANLPKLADKMPGSEAVLALTPDLVYSGWESAFAGDAAGERTTLAGLGVASYVEPSACRSSAPEKVTFDSMLAEVSQVGQIMDANAQAATVTGDLHQRLAAIQPAGAGRNVVWWSSDSKSPYVGAGTGAPDAIMEKVGLKNAFGDLGAPWKNVSWEEFASANPDVIVVADATWSKAETKIKRLKGNAATKDLDAVKNDRIVVLPFAATETGVRNVDAAEQLNDALAALQ